MAVLNESDLKKILGPNFRALQLEAETASGMLQEERTVVARIDSLDGKRMVSFYFALTGIVLILASLASVKGQTLFIQCAVGGAILLAGLVPFVFFTRDMSRMRALLTTIRGGVAPTPAVA